MILPNQLTVLRIILTPIFLYLFLNGEPLFIQISLGVFIIAAITDWYDGWLARKFNYITEWGKFLDPLADKILTSTVFLAFVFVGILELWMVILIIARDILITLLRIYADYKKVSFSTSYSAKWKTFFQMLFLYYLLLIYTAKTVKWIYEGRENLFNILLHHELIYYTMLAITIFTVITGITYIYTNRLLIKQLFGAKN
ncbi:MAG: CDP-diacylglycerol--glycerol-3-phosphate 3-phosphatidyltransferase [Melioribacter sp.]|uniref:CDP-diacylglycerol--glycerol-3-phosphate 3-phosphatidyltransferase n=1 Tax=Rosettibacter primus TaxID=3111523 RepID=UPI00247BC9AF|nr:CDP-diacylglycerol--glycerol-3-phosphate 3-phosphatidyltransferase [Melioribacter sp.]